MADTIDVLVVGAGPVGLLAAILLQQQGLTFRVIEKKSERSKYSGGLGIWRRTLQLLETCDLAKDIVTAGNLIQHVHFRQPGKTLVDVWLRLSDTQLPVGIILAQWDIERIFEERLIAATGNEAIVQRSTELVSYTQEEDHVEAFIKSTKDSNTTETINCRYLIGADGVHSMVRKQAKDWFYEGKSYTTEFAIVDLPMEHPLVSPRDFTIFATPEGLTAFLPLRSHDKLYRLIMALDDFKVKDENKRGDVLDHGVTQSDGLNSRGETITLQDVEKELNERVAPDNFELKDPLWVSTFRINERKANGFRRGRAFVIGDAAHCHSPVGGQGMNMGMQDAHNLVWKLAQVIKGFAKDSEQLLDSYSVEREPIAAKVLSLTGGLTSFAMKRNILSSMLRQTAVPFAFRTSSIKQRLFQTMAGAYVSYSSSPLHFTSRCTRLQEDEKKKWIRWSTPEGASLIAPGQYCPEKSLSLLTDGPVGSTTTINSILNKTHRYTILLLVNNRSILLENNQLLDFVAKLYLVNTQIFSLMVVSVMSAVEWHEVSQLKNHKLLPNMYGDAGGNFHASLGIPDERQAVVALRPDGYVCFAGMAINGDEAGLQDEVSAWHASYFNQTNEHV